VSKSLPEPGDPLACCTPLTREPMTRDQAEPVAALLKALGDPVRLRLMSLVLSHADAEACVCDLLPAFELSQPTISHHLKVLHETGLLDREKRGVWVYYKARPAALAALASLFATDAAAGVPAGPLLGARS
jgi:ArsR family transcriptional regulator, arsenate/arsenite/antimonite-responsive transcriptional repressor